jgi:hypothetical protein
MCARSGTVPSVTIQLPRCKAPQAFPSSWRRQARTEESGQHLICQNLRIVNGNPENASLDDGNADGCPKERRVPGVHDQFDVQPFRIARPLVIGLYVRDSPRPRST